MHDWDVLGRVIPGQIAEIVWEALQDGAQSLSMAPVKVEKVHEGLAPVSLRRPVIMELVESAI